MINRQRLVSTFLELAQIDSPSGEESVIARLISSKLKKLGANVIIDSYGNLIAKKEGIGTPLMLNVHMDTVEPGRGVKPIVEKSIIKSNGDTILGADPKAGLAIIIEALQSLHEDKKRSRSLELVFTKEEEASLGGAINLDYSNITAKEGVVFDGDEEVFKIFLSSPTYYALDVEIIGRSAHAGIEPEKGISAIEIASKIISRLNLGRLDVETTFNIGVIKGGSVRNAVPEKVTFEGEIRSRDKNKLEKILRQTEMLFNSFTSLYPDAKISLELKKDFEGFVIPKTHRMIKNASFVLKKLNLKPELKDSGGGSDANIFFTHGIEAIIVGTGVHEPHTTREYLNIDQMYDAARFCEEFVLSK